jgi:hypothetical protein
MEDEESALRYEKYRRSCVNYFRAQNLQKALEGAGYLSAPPAFAGNKMPLSSTLVNLLVDFLHLMDSQGQRLDPPALQQIVEDSHALFDKEPRLDPSL